jgi:hypothetical protein
VYGFLEPRPVFASESAYDRTPAQALMKQSILATLLVALAAGCGNSNDHGTIALLVTDAPIPYELVRSAKLQFDRITIDGGPNSSLGERVLYEGEPYDVEIAGLRNGVVRHLFSRNVPLHVYSRLHVHVCGGELTLTNGRVFSTAERTLDLPHYGGFDLEIPIQMPITVSDGHWSRLLLDVDLPRSFVPQGTSDLQQAERVRFEPLVHAVRPGLTGEIRGLVSRDDGQGNLVAVGDATLYFQPAGIEDLQLAEATTGTDADGSFAKIGLPPGTYDIVAVKGGSTITRSGCLVVATEYSVVELTLP